MNEKQTNDNLPNISLENSNTAGSGEKRGRGRPKKEDTYESTLVTDLTEKRGRGRPKKEETEQAPAETGEKRGRGRPKKEDTFESTLVTDSSEKRGRGRPKKETPMENNTTETGEKRGRGRPRKEDTAPVSNDEPKAFKPITLAGRPTETKSPAPIETSANMEEDEDDSFDLSAFGEEDDEDASDILTSLDPYSFYSKSSPESTTANVNSFADEEDDYAKDDDSFENEEPSAPAQYNEPAQATYDEQIEDEQAEVSSEEDDYVVISAEEPVEEETISPAQTQMQSSPAETEAAEEIPAEAEPAYEEPVEAEPEPEPVDTVALSEEQVKQADEELADIERKQEEERQKELEKQEEERRKEEEKRLKAEQKAEEKRIKAEKKAEKKRIKEQKRKIRAEKRKLKPRIYSPLGVLLNLLFTALAVTHVVLEVLKINPLSKLLKDWSTNANGLEVQEILGKFLYVAISVIAIYFALFIFVYILSHFKRKWVGGILMLFVTIAAIVLPNTLITLEHLSLEDTLANEIYMHLLLTFIPLLAIIPVFKVSTTCFALQFKKIKLIKKQTVYSCFVINSLEQTLYATLIAIAYFTKIAYSSHVLVVLTCNVALFVFISLMLMFNLSLLSKKNNTVHIFSIVKNLKGAIAHSNKLSNDYEPPVSNAPEAPTQEQTEYPAEEFAGYDASEPTDDAV